MVPSAAGSDKTGDIPAEAVRADRPSSGVSLPSAQQADASGGAPAPGSHVRWWVAVAVGLVVSIPFAWLLSYAGMLLFYLGLFFYALFGLVIGAVVYRVASPGRPYGRPALVVGTSVIVLFGWAFSVLKESRDFPRDVANKAAANPKLRFGGRSMDEYRAEVAQQVRGFLRERYPPGGVIGYVGWITSRGEMTSADVASLKEPLKRSQRKHWWVIRVGLSVALLAFGVGSQTLPLKVPAESRAGGDRPSGE